MILVYFKYPDQFGVKHFNLENFSYYGLFGKIRVFGPSVTREVKKISEPRLKTLSAS